MAISDHRHAALLRVVHATPDFLQEAHALLLQDLRDTNIRVAVNDQHVLLTRDWYESPGKAVISFPDDETATRVCDESGASAAENPFTAALLPYSTVDCWLLAVDCWLLAHSSRFELWPRPSA